MNTPIHPETLPKSATVFSFALSRALTEIHEALIFHRTIRAISFDGTPRLHWPDPIGLAIPGITSVDALEEAIKAIGYALDNKATCNEIKPGFADGDMPKMQLAALHLFPTAGEFPLVEYTAQKGHEMPSLPEIANALIGLVERAAQCSNLWHVALYALDKVAFVQTIEMAAMQMADENAEVQP